MEKSGGGSRGGNNLLTVDEGVRPRANSDPTVTTGGMTMMMMMLPEIKVEDCTDPDLSSNNPNHQPDNLPSGFGAIPPRPRSNTCPEDLFRKPRNGRPPTPPPGTFRKGHRFKSGFTKPALKESVSFAHHRLSKLAESEDAEDPNPHIRDNAHHRHLPSSSSSPTSFSEACQEEEEEDETAADMAERLPSQLGRMELDSTKPSTTTTTTAAAAASNSSRDRISGETPSSPKEPCSSETCGRGGGAGGGVAEDDADSSLKNGGGCAVSDTGSAEDASFVSQQAAVKCRCAQSSAATLDSKQLQAC
ncbi:uncharacterized protein LOC143279530 [Babylonia areolata]|uniref:uncharacterized protein LOC143279530 n=1 Tax=Babylonia areolata TaxID=304850 RepID=UPI003FD62A3C